MLTYQAASQRGCDRESQSLTAHSAGPGPAYSRQVPSVLSRLHAIQSVGRRRRTFDTDGRDHAPGSSGGGGGGGGDGGGKNKIRNKIKARIRKWKHARDVKKDERGSNKRSNNNDDNTLILLP